MHSVDKKLIRRKLGSVEVGKKTYDLLQPSMGQYLEHTVETEEALKTLKELDPNSKDSEIKYLEWLIRELQIFVPEITRDVALTLTHEQRREIMSYFLTYGTTGDEAPVEEESTQKKSKEVSWREVIGRICRVFTGESLSSCLAYTKEQVLALYWESFRQEARGKLLDINNIMVTKADSDSRKDVIRELQLQAYPFDPEHDEDMDQSNMDELKKVLDPGVILG